MSQTNGLRQPEVVSRVESLAQMSDRTPTMTPTINALEKMTAMTARVSANESRIGPGNRNPINESMMPKKSAPTTPASKLLHEFEWWVESSGKMGSDWVTMTFLRFP